MPTSSQKASVHAAVQDGDPEAHSSGSELDHQQVGGDQNAAPEASQASSTKRKNKKRSKISKALNTLRGNEIPQSIVTHVAEQVKAEQGEDSTAADHETIRMALEQLKIMDVLKGKSGVAGRGKKAMGEHKVRAFNGRDLCSA